MRISPSARRAETQNGHQMKTRRATYDPKCHDLAEHFFADEPAKEALVGELAARIQRAVEDWFEENRAAAS